MPHLSPFPDWLIKLFPSLQPMPYRRSDEYDYEIPSSRLQIDRLPITRPSSPCLLPHPVSQGAVPSSDYVSAARAQAQAQAQAPAQENLLEILPLEIRQKIWFHVLGAQTIHLEFDQGHRGSKNCLSADSRTCDGRYASNGDDLNHRPQLSEEPGRPLCLITTCKQIYQEAIDILYTSNTFTVCYPPTMEFLPLTLLPQRLDTIRDLRFSWDFRGPPPFSESFWRRAHCSDSALITIRKRQRAWLNIWRIMSTMTGLRQLYVKLNVDETWAVLSLHSATELLEPIKQVTQPDHFVLSLPFPPMYENMPPPTIRSRWVAKSGWEGSDPWDDLSNCKIQRVGVPRAL
ncbi:hypothetical protein BKA65DRAFT_541580 [Rhexocercosporidium sp. MPI-PUGE-AT-0058]|nr:hypothetical protein BKA65DRAFT_541580 [Rhexocercosporidium sp. MPI-PUGE-AT-0058]